MNELSWRIRRAAARWLFVERRMEIVAEEISIGTVPFVSGHRPGHRYDTLAGEHISEPERVTLYGSSRQIDVLGLTPADEKAARKRDLRAIEVKISRGDLAHGIKNGQISNGPGGIGSVVDYAHLLVADGVRVDFGELPPGWGVLIAREVLVGSRDGVDRTAIHIDITKPARRIVPTRAIDTERVARAMVQASLWRLYHPTTEVTFTRYSDNGHTWGDRKVAAG